MAKKRAVLVGINYPNTPYQLNGCINDVMLMSQVITERFGFTDPLEKRTLTDRSATTKNILERLDWLVDGAEPGDVLLFFYSGHGSQMIQSDYSASREPDGVNEVICPIDIDWRRRIIRDDDFRARFDKVPTSVNVTVILDCCNSGSGIDSRNAFQPFGAEKLILDPNSPNKAKVMPMPPDIANRALGLKIGVKSRDESKIPECGLLISGCQSHQTSSDAWIHNKYQGAATFFMIENLKRARWNSTYKTLVTRMNRDLKKYGYSQRPELNGSSGMFTKKFLKPFTD